MAEFFDYDPVTGVRYSTEQDGEDTLIIRHEDVEGLLNRNKAIANAGLGDKDPKKGIFWRHYCDIPLTVIVELRNKGIDIFNKNHGKRMFEEINRNYPYLKQTHKVHVPHR